MDFWRTKHVKRWIFLNQMKFFITLPIELIHGLYGLKLCYLVVTAVISGVLDPSGEGCMRNVDPA